MDQLCSKPHTTADKGCTEAGDQLSFAQTGLRLQKNISDNCMGNSFYSCMDKKVFHNILKYSDNLCVYNSKSYILI